MAQNYNATENEVWFQQVLLTEPITIPANGSVPLRIVCIAKCVDQDDNSAQQEEN